MKKYSIMMLAIFFILILVVYKSVNTNRVEKELPAENSSDLELNEATYSENEIKILYPQIENQNLQAETTINQKIKQSALSILDRYENEIEGLSVDIDYTAEMIDHTILSICFKGITHVKNAAYPNNVFYTSNLDIDTGEILTSKDILDVNTDVIENIKRNAKYVPQEKGVSEELVFEVNRMLEEYEIDQIQAEIESPEISENRIYIYLKQNTIGFSFPVLHVLGDYANFEMEYKHSFKSTPQIYD